MSNVVRIPILADRLSGKYRYCTTVMAYFKANGLGAGDTWIAHEYMEWIDTKHEEFRKLISSPCCDGYNAEQRAAFEEFIFEEEPTDG